MADSTGGGSTKDASAHPYMPNALADIKAEMLAGTDASSIEELFAQIPADHRLSRPLDMPRQLRSEVELRRHMLDMLGANEHCERNLSFLGAGCWQHHVPAVCDEIVGRAEFLTPVWGTPSSDLGRNQALFEFTSQLGELLEMDFVGLPVYSYGCASGHAIRMAARITGRRQVLVARSTDPERMSVIRNYCEPPEMPGSIEIVPIDYNLESGQVEFDQLRERLSNATAAVYLESPSYLGLLETRAADVAALTRQHGAEMILGVDPIALGAVAPPGDLGVDIAVGPIQTLGVHMNCGGGAGGFIASRDEERYAREYPTLMVSACATHDPAQLGFGMTLIEQSSYGAREDGKDWTGNSVYLWAIAAAVYMTLMGPRGFREIGEIIVSRSHYAAARLHELPGVDVRFSKDFFKEFVVDLNGTGRSVAEINAALRGHGIFGGRDLSEDFPELGQSALYCVTEIHAQQDVDRLVDALAQELPR